MSFPLTSIVNVEYTKISNIPSGSVNLGPLYFQVLSYRREDLYEKMLGGSSPSQLYYKLWLEVYVYDRDVKWDYMKLTFSQTFPVEEPEAASLRTLLHTAVCHEVDECIYVDGVRVFDPHVISP